MISKYQQNFSSYFDFGEHWKSGWGNGGEKVVKFGCIRYCCHLSFCDEALIFDG